MGGMLQADMESKIRKAFIISQPGRASFIASSILRMISGQHCLATSMRA